MKINRFIFGLALLGSVFRVFGADYPENRDYGQLGDFLWKEGVQFGRTANLTNIGPYLINLPEDPGSSGVDLPGNQYIHHDTAWDLSDLANPIMAHEFSSAGQPIHAHATVIRFGDNGPRLMARSSGDIGYDPATSQLILDDGIDWPSGIFGYSMMTSPFYVRDYWSYSLNRAGVIAIHDPSNPLEQPSPNEWTYTDGPLVDLFGGNVGTWLGVPYVYWDHFNVANVTGFNAFMGNLMVMSSDQLSTGMAIYDVSGVRDGRAPRLLSTYQPQRTEPNGNPIGIGGYWVEPYGTTKMVYAARKSESMGRSYPALYVVNFEDPYNPHLTCEIYFDQDKQNSSDGDNSSDPMYVNFQDEYIYVDHFKVNLPACEEAFDAGQSISGDVFNEVVYRFNDIPESCDGSQYFRPIGQVGIFGGYDWWQTSDVNEQGMCAFVTSDEPDNNPPFISGHRPLTGQETYPIDGFIHIHVPETLRTETVENAITITNTNSNQTIDFRMIMSHTGTISIFPINYLDPNSSYQVDVVGIQDFMGNTMIDYSFNFTTGSADLLQGDTPFPEFDYDNPPTPAEIHTGDQNDEDETGDDEDLPVPTYSGTAYFPIQSSSIACTSESESGDIWAVNPDNDSISIVSSQIDEDTLVKTHQFEQEVHLLYESPTSVTRLNNDYVITFSVDDKVIFFDTSGNPLSSIDTGHGTQPIASVADEQHLYVSLYGSGEIIKIDFNSKTIVERTYVGPKPKAMALHGNRLLVTRFISPLEHGEVYDIDISSGLSLNGTIVINKLTVGDDIDHGAGVPNYLSSIVISNDGQTAYVSATKANTDRGTRPGSSNPQQLDGDNTVRPMVAILDLLINEDANTDPATRSGTIDLDNSADPSAVTFLANGQVRITALQGNNILVFNDMVQNAQAQFDTQGAPQGLCTTRRSLYVKNHTSRSITVIDVAAYMANGDLQQVTEHIGTVQNEILTAEEKLGLELFYNSSMPEMGPEGYMTCASCHFDGGHDGRVWDITNLGEGLRNTISLNGASGTRFGALHWSGNFDEVQDFELQIEKLNGGEGLIPGTTFAEESPLEVTTAEQSEDLDALANYITGLGKDTVKHSPNRTYTGELTESAVRGETLFAQANCNSCHSGKAFRDGQTHDVGTINAESGNRLGELGGFTHVRTPTLIELWDSAPYFHNGTAATLEDVLSIGIHEVNLTNDELQDLVNYLLSIDRDMYIEDDEEFIVD